MSRRTREVGLRFGNEQVGGGAAAIGVTERHAACSRATLYNTVLLFDHNGMLILYRRKLMPTYKERTVWGQGDASSLVTAEVRWVRVGGLIGVSFLMPPRGRLRRSRRRRGASGGVLLRCS